MAQTGVSEHVAVRTTTSLIDSLAELTDRANRDPVRDIMVATTRAPAHVIWTDRLPDGVEVRLSADEVLLEPQLSENTEPFELDDNVLEGIAWLICGDDTASSYRMGHQIEKFFRAAGWTDIGELDGYRRGWTLDQLTRRKHDPTALRRVVLRLADPREYLDDDKARAETVEEVNRLLGAEGYKVTYSGNRPVITQSDAGADRINTDTPAELSANLAEVVSDEVFGAQLRARLDEAYRCWQVGAPTAAIIMLGSLLEGVLYDVACSRHTTGPKPVDNLQALIDLARALNDLADAPAAQAPRPATEGV